jgi:hypothetical protein
MKYRVRTDLSFDSEQDARDCMDDLRLYANKAVSINEGEPNEEIAFCDLEICRHDEGLPCTRLERFEVRKLEEQPL